MVFYTISDPPNLMNPNILMRQAACGKTVKTGRGLLKRGCLAFVGFGLVGLGLCPLGFFLRSLAVCTFGVVWAPWPPDAMESFVPVGPLPSVFLACFRGGLLRLLLWLPPRSALSIWGQFRSKFTQSRVCAGVFCQSAIENAQNDHAAVVQNILDNKDTSAGSSFDVLYFKHLQ